jgi:DNA-binding HxlR family transcriptional regulator
MRKLRHEIARVALCPMKVGLDSVGGNWKGVILFCLTDRACALLPVLSALMEWSQTHIYAKPVAEVPINAIA